MVILESLKIENYRNIRNAKLDGLKDLNIFIGPNNCGKSNILKTIGLLKNSEFRVGMPVGDDAECYAVKNEWNRLHDNTPSNQKFLVMGLKCNSDKNDAAFRENNFRIEYAFNSSYLASKLKEISPQVTASNFYEALLQIVVQNPNMSKEIKEKTITYLKGVDLNKLTLKQESHFNYALSEHISLISIGKLIGDFKESIIVIDESRLQKYKDVSIPDYIRNKGLMGSDLNTLIAFLNEIVDANINDYTHNTLELIKYIDERNHFATSIDEQGSGVRSLICIGADILSSQDGSIILIDEPELGLNPATKQEFLKFLIDQSSRKQIFIATHDPAFANPFILSKERTSIYLYSPIYDRKNKSSKNEPNFIKINIQESLHTFGGYLPHSESLKPIHIYVEGHRDVINLQTILFNEKGSERFNEIGIYHLGGNCWKHLLYTIPDSPYVSIVLLDNDKSSEAKEICKNYRELMGGWSRFLFCEKIEDIMRCINPNVRTTSNSEVPVYCIESGCVEDLKSIEDNNLEKIFERLIETADARNKSREAIK